MKKPTGNLSVPDRKIFLVAALCWTTLITLLSLISLGDVGGSIKILYKDKMVHFVFYFVFTLLWFRFSKTGIQDQKKALVVFFAAIGYGLLMELCQSLFTSNRTADLFDGLANSCGALTALLIINYKFLNKRQP